MLSGHKFLKRLKTSIISVSVILLSQSCAHGMGAPSVNMPVNPCKVKLYSMSEPVCVYRMVGGEVKYICPDDEEYKADFIVVSLEDTDCLEIYQATLQTKCKKWK
jgi:hypothetical protein